MQMSEGHQRLLVATLHRRFGAQARLWVFGSRVDDLARGGDVDLLVRTPLDDAAGPVDARLHFLADLQSWPEFEGQKVDLVLLTPLHPGYAGAAGSLAPIHRVALSQGVELT